MTDTQSHTAFDCEECDYEIRPGDKRVPTADGALHIGCVALREARQQYRFTLTNPQENQGVSIILWYDAGKREYPILFNTNGLNSIVSASKVFGDSGYIEPTTSFFHAIGYAYHWLQSYRPLPEPQRIRDEIDREIPRYYENEKIPDHEKWAIHHIVSQMYISPAVPAEWEPIVEYCDTITKFNVPDVVPVE